MVLAFLIPLNVLNGELFAGTEGINNETSCFVPVYQDKTNLVPNPTCDDLSGFGGWGTKSVNTDPANVYCGEKSISVKSPWGGTLELNNLKPNTVYRFIAKVYVPNGLVAKFAVCNHSYGEGDINLWVSDRNDTWETVDMTFKTNDCNTTSIYYVGDVGDGWVYIDNYEAYIVDEPTIRIRYLDENGDALKDDRVIEGIWGLDTSGYISIGHEYVASSDKQEISKDEQVYRYDESSGSDRIIIEEGENLLELRFKEAVEPSSNVNLLSIAIPDAQLVPAFSSDITEYTALLAGKTEVKPVCEKLESAQFISGDGEVDLTSGSGRSEIVVTAENGSTTKTYIINYKVIPSDDSFVQTYPDRENLIQDPYCSDLSKFGGWGTKNINNDLNYVFNGNTSIAMAAPFKGTLEVSLSPNTAYRLIAQTYTTKGVTAQFGWFNHGMGDGDVHFNITTENEVWQKADFTLKTSDAGGSIFFVGENGNGFAYIDNYELYVVQEPTVRIHYVDAEGNTLKEDAIVEGNWTSLDPSQYLMIGHEYVASAADCASFEVNGVYYRFDDESSQDRVVLAEGENELTLTFKAYAVPVVLNETDENFQLQQSVYSDVTVNREMTAGKWHSFCIPFDMTTAQLEENGIIEVQKLNEVVRDDNKVVLNFTEQDKIEGGIPYLIKVGSDIQSINVKGVMLNKAAPVDLTVEGITMCGAFTKTSLSSNEFFLKDDRFYLADIAVQVMGFRSYVVISEEEYVGANQLYLNIGGDVTSVKGMNSPDSLVDVYTVTGRKVKQNVKHSEALHGLCKGLYIVGNKKVIVK